MFALGEYHEIEVGCGLRANHDDPDHRALSRNRIASPVPKNAKERKWQEGGEVTWEWPVTAAEREQMNKDKAREAAL